MPGNAADNETGCAVGRMGEFMESGLILLLLLGAFALQYYLVRRPQKWLSLPLPCASVALAALNAVMSARTGDSVLGGAVVTALFVFIVSNMNTVLLGVIYWKRDSGLGPTLGTMIFAWISMLLLYSVVVFILSLFLA